MCATTDAGGEFMAAMCGRFGECGRLGEKVPVPIGHGSLARLIFWFSLIFWFFWAIPDCHYC
jgi:hypothetical protein